MTELSREVLDRFRSLERDASRERGEFALFALFAREELPDRWDLVVSAPWAASSQDAAEYLVEQIKSKIGAEALVSLSRIVAVDPSDASVQALNDSFHVEHGGVEVRDRDLLGLAIKLGYIITSHRLSPASAE